VYSPHTETNSAPRRRSAAGRHAARRSFDDRRRASRRHRRLAPGTATSLSALHKVGHHGAPASPRPPLTRHRGQRHLRAKHAKAARAPRTGWQSRRRAADQTRAALPPTPHRARHTAAATATALVVVCRLLRARRSPPFGPEKRSLCKAAPSPSRALQIPCAHPPRVRACHSHARTRSPLSARLAPGRSFKLQAPRGSGWRARGWRPSRAPSSPSARRT
jgi:hypothetical protein